MRHRNQPLILALATYRDFRSGKLTADQGFQQWILSELEPRERIILHYVTNHPNCRSGDVVDTEVIELRQTDNILKRLVDLGLLERTKHSDQYGLFYTYKTKGWDKQ